MQHSEGVGVLLPTAFWDCRLLAGSLARSAAHTGVGHRLLSREGKLKSPVPTHTGQRSGVWGQSHSDRTLLYVLVLTRQALPSSSFSSSS